MFNQKVGVVKLVPEIHVIGSHL